VAATQSVKSLESANLVIEELELLEEFVSFETTGTYFAINELAFFLDITSQCGPFSVDSRHTALRAKTCSPSILYGQPNTNISIASQALPADVKKKELEKRRCLRQGTPLTVQAGDW